jgi:hypothetical protein
MSEVAVGAMGDFEKCLGLAKLISIISVGDALMPISSHILDNKSNDEPKKTVSRISKVRILG